MPTDDPVFCQRCRTLLHLGKSACFLVRIEAMADPTPPQMDAAALAAAPETSMAQLLEQIRELSEQELMDAVHRRLAFYLCARCYPNWIENPTG